MWRRIIKDRKLKIIAIACIAGTLMGSMVIPVFSTDTNSKHNSPDNSSIGLINDVNGILYVGGSGPGNYTTIQLAVNNANTGDTVYVYDDSSPYYEHVDINTSIHFIGGK